MTLQEIKEAIEDIMMFGEIPAFVCECTHKYIYVCRNNGCFHKGNADNTGGWATFVGKFTIIEANEYFDL